MSRETLNLTSEVYQYFKVHSLREPEILQDLRAKTSQLTGANMQISPEQGQFMALLVQLMRAKKTLDIGTFTGYSALAVALALPDVGKVITCDINNEYPSIAQKYWRQAQVADKIDLRIAPALETLQALLPQEAGSFDFIFIDADKNNYQNYYELSLQLLRTGGLIIIDNVLWGGSVADKNVHDKVTASIRQFNSFLHQDERVTLSMIPMSDGMTLALKR